MSFRDLQTHSGMHFKSIGLSWFSLCKTIHVVNLNPKPSYHKWTLRSSLNRLLLGFSTWLCIWTYRGTIFSTRSPWVVFFPGVPGGSMRELRPCSTWALDDVLTSADYHHLDPRLWVSNGRWVGAISTWLTSPINYWRNTIYFNLCFLKALENIHPGQRRITFPSAFCVSDVGRSIITRYHPLINLQDFKAFEEMQPEYDKAPC